MKWLLFLWLTWCAFNFAIMLAGATLLRPRYVQFDGFRIHLPVGWDIGLTQRERLAVVSHECGHRYHWHPWKNLARLCCLVPLTPRERRAQEFEADDYCTDPEALAMYLGRSTHPFDLLRAQRLAAVAIARGIAEAPIKLHQEAPAGRRQPYPRDAGHHEEEGK